MRRALIAAVAATAVLVPLLPAAASPPDIGPAMQQTKAPGTDYVDRVNNALRRKDDQWGEKLIKQTNGPTFESLESLLVPAFQANTSLTDSSWVYLPQTYPVPEPTDWGLDRRFSLHVIDGSQLVTDWAETKHYGRNDRKATFKVDGDEIYGSRPAALATPALAGGHLPILTNSYTDDSGTRWDRESFVSRLNGELVSWVKFTVYGEGATTLKVNLIGDGVSSTTASAQRVYSGGHTYLKWAGEGSWTAPNLTIPVEATTQGTPVYLMVPNTPSATDFPVDAAAYEQAKTTITTYWNNLLADGAKVEIPEEYASQAMRNLLIQNLVMGWQQSVGNGYESHVPPHHPADFAFVPEVSASVQVLGEFGHSAAMRKHLKEILGRGQEPDRFRNWEYGFKLQSAASYYLLTGDASYLRDNLPTFNSYLSTMAAERDLAGSNGLVSKNMWASDIGTKVWGVHHQAEAWRGMRDLGIALKQAGMTADAARFTAEANDFETSLRSAISRSQTWLPDGSLYVPVSLLDPSTDAAYDQLTSSRYGSYWNLTIGYFLATGLFKPGSAEAKGIAKYLYQHGALFTGLTRFNLVGVDPGVCTTYPDHFGGNAPGYKASGIDEQYGYSRVRFLSDNDEADRLTLNLYGKLAHDLTPKTFIGGEGATIAPCPELNEYYRTQFYPPLSANNATYLGALRATLVKEELAADGTPAKLRLTPATPRPWLADGKRVAVEGLPTKFGPVTYQVESHLAQNYIDATVTPPTRNAPQAVELGLRTPAGYKLTSVTINGTTRAASGEVVDLGAITQATTVRANYEAVAVPRNDQAEVTMVAPDNNPVTKAVFQPGQTVNLNPTIEVLGTTSVPGNLTVTLPSGWTAPAAKPFDIASDNQIAWGKTTVAFTIPTNAAEGEHEVGLVATPTAGTATTYKWKIKVARPVAESYPDFMKAHGPTAYWRLGETGGTFADSSPYGTTATGRESVQGGEPGAIADDPNGSVRLSGGYVDTPHALAVTPSGPSTFEAWIKIKQGKQQGILEKYSSPSVNGFAVRTGFRNALELHLMSGDKDVRTTLYGRQSILPGQWHHVVVAYDRNWMDIYLDGKLDIRAPASVMPTVGNSPLRIGARGDDAGERLDGWMDEVAMYGYPLSAATVEAHYLKGVLGNRR